MTCIRGFPAFCPFSSISPRAESTAPAYVTTGQDSRPLAGVRRAGRRAVARITPRMTANGRKLSVIRSGHRHARYRVGVSPASGSRCRPSPARSRPRSRAHRRRWRTRCRAGSRAARWTATTSTSGTVAVPPVHRRGDADPARARPAPRRVRVQHAARPPRPSRPGERLHRGTPGRGGAGRDQGRRSGRAARTGSRARNDVMAGENSSSPAATDSGVTEMRPRRSAATSVPAGPSASGMASSGPPNR